LDSPEKQINFFTQYFRGGWEMVLDVVCNMDIDEKASKWKSEYKGKTYYFCAPMCKQKFDRNPEKYVKTE